MVIMEDYRLSRISLHELWQEIERSHLSYLEMDETPDKIEQRAKLEEYIHEFLCVAANYQKYSLPETQEVLHRSTTCKKDFSAYKASIGFNAIQQYASNLLAQPWRKEYRQIKIYCGYYKHQVEANLAGAEKLFEAMGYRLYGNGLMVLDGPICPDRVTAVSKDCLIAYVECQIWKAVWEALTPTSKITWLDILELRNNHVCSPEQALRALKYKNRQYQDHTRTYSDSSDMVLVPRNQLSPLNNSFPPLSSHLHVGLPPVQVQEPQYVNGCCPTPFQYPYATYSPATYSTNGYHHVYSVPTAKLIEVGHSGGSFDVVDHKSGVPSDLYVSKNSAEQVAEKNGSQLEDWDYVYRNLESQGYTKDLGERGDVLSPNSLRQLREMKKPKETSVEEAFSNLKLAGVETKPQPKTSYGKSKTLPRERPPGENKAKGSKEEKGSKKKASDDKLGSPSWYCKVCTFLNQTGKDICEMCGKSRVVAVEKPMEVGGAECSTCTLVNPKNATACQACSASLEGSPTYI